MSKVAKWSEMSIRVAMLKRNSNIVSDVQVGNWFHLELMDDGKTSHGDGVAKYWMALGDLSFDIVIYPQGRVEITPQGGK